MGIGMTDNATARESLPSSDAVLTRRLPAEAPCSEGAGEIDGGEAQRSLLALGQSEHCGSAEQD